MVPTESLFNSTVKEIFNSQLCGSYAFIERSVEQIPKKMLTTEENLKLTKEFDEIHPVIKANKTYKKYLKEDIKLL